MFVGNPQEFIQSQQELHDKAYAEAQELRASIDRMLDELSPEHAYTLYRLLAYISLGNITQCHFIAGQLSTILRVVHKACMTCGSTQHTDLTHGVDLAIPDPEVIAKHDSHLFHAVPDCSECMDESIDTAFEQKNNEEENNELPEGS